MYLYVSWECMFRFFRKCLDLFPTPPPPEIRSELNLIASLALLDDFGIKMLPVQVRLCENKLDLIRSCLDSSPTAYKSVHVVSLVFLFVLFYLLHVTVQGSPHTDREWSTPTTTRQFLPPICLPPLRLVLPSLTKGKKC